MNRKQKFACTICALIGLVAGIWGAYQLSYQPVQLEIAVDVFIIIMSTSIGNAIGMLVAYFFEK